LKLEHLADEEQTAPNAHDDIRAEAYEKQAANLNFFPGQEERQKNENGDSRMNRNPEILKGYSRIGLYNRKGRWR
jgi:hypothetical protein